MFLSVFGLLTQTFCFEGDPIRKEKASTTAYKVALNGVTLGAKPGMDKVLPLGIVDATEKLLIASGAASATMVRWSRSQRMVSVLCFMKIPFYHVSGSKKRGISIMGHLKKIKNLSN
ncbi:MAG: hypothetical protein ACMUJM_16605 [bacterium]